MSKKKRSRAIVVLTSLFLCLIMFFGIANTSIMKVFAAENSDYDTEKVLYLSDKSRISHDKSKSTSYGNSRLFMAPSEKASIPGGAAQAKIEGAWYTFNYGVYAHGASYVTFDISQYSNTYKYFSAYAGLLSSASKSDGAFFYVLTSNLDSPTSAAGDWTRVTEVDTTVDVINGKQWVKYNQNFLHFTFDVTGVKWIKLVADANNTIKDANGNNLKFSNAQDYVMWADAKLTTTLDEGEAVKSLAAYDAEIKAKVLKGADLDDKSLELLVLQREFVSRVGQYALKRFTGESEDNKAMLGWLLNDLDNLREFMLGGTPFKGNYYNSLNVLSNLYKSYKNDLSDTTLLSGDGKPGTGNKFMPDRTFGELCRTMMFSVALTHDSTIGSYLQGGYKVNQSEANRRYAIFKYMYQTERFVATRNADGSWKSETMNMFGSLKVEEMRWLMCAIIDDESLIWLNDYVQTRINNAPNNVGNLYTPHSYVRYTDPNYNNPVFYAAENYDYFNALFSVDSREVKVGDNVIISDDNAGTALDKEQILDGKSIISYSAHNNANITHYGLWDSKYIVPAGEGEEPYEMSVSRTVDGVAKLQKVWMNFNNKFKTGSVCGGISKSGVNIRTSRGIPANVIGQPGHAAILYFSKDANGKGSWKIDNDVGGWLAATKGERHLLGWGNDAWQRNSGGTVVYFHLAQLCLDDYDNLVRAEEYCWLAKVYQGDLDKQEKLYEKALTTQILNLDAWYGLVQTYKANTSKTASDYSDLAGRIGDTLWNHPTPMHCLFRLFTDTERTNIAEVQATLDNPIFVTQLKTIEINALARAKASGSTAAKSKVNYLLGLSDTSVADFSFDGENAGCIVWSDTYKDSTFTWKYSLDGKNTWTEVTFYEGDSHAHQLSEKELNSISTDNDIYVYIVGANPDNAYKIDVAAKPALPDTLYANDWENRIIGVDGTYEWRYCSVTNKETETGTETTYTPISNWRCFADASPDCTGEKAIEVRIKGTAKKPSSESKVFTFTNDTDIAKKKYISIDYLSMETYSTQPVETDARKNYAVNAIDGNVNTYWHTDYRVNLKAVVLDEKGNPKPYAPAYLIIKLADARWLSALEFSQRQYNSSFSIFAKKVTVYVSETGEDGSWKEAGRREDLENIADLNVVNFESIVDGERVETSFYGQYIKLELTELYETNTNDGVFTTVSLINLYEDTTKTSTPAGNKMPSWSEIEPSRNSMEGFGAIVTQEEVAGEELIPDEEFSGFGPQTPDESNPVLWIVLSVIGVVLVAAAVVFVLYKRGIIKFSDKNNTDKGSELKATTAETKATAAKSTTNTAKPVVTATTPKASTAKTQVTAAKPKTNVTETKVTAKPKTNTPETKVTAKPKAATPESKVNTTKPKNK